MQVGTAMNQAISPELSYAFGANNITKAKRLVITMLQFGAVLNISSALTIFSGLSLVLGWGFLIGFGLRGWLCPL